MAPSAKESVESLRLESKAVGPLPILNHILERAKIDELLREFVPMRDGRQKVEPAVGLGIMLRNILVSRRPLYDLTEWAKRFDPALLGLPAEMAPSCLNDDRFGRCLDGLFLADRASLLTRIILHVVREFRLDLKELHNDSTTVTFSGEYEQGDGRQMMGKSTKRITHGHNKDGRPDLKQLLYILTTTADGSVPILFHVDHGNTADISTHVQTWDRLREIAGTPSFMYCADSKLFSKENLSHIDRHKGRFVTVIPKTCSEHEQFYEWLGSNDVPWVDILTRPNQRKKDGEPSIYRGYEHPTRTVHGYRVIWIWSSKKEALDRGTRERHIEAAQAALQELSTRIGQPRQRLKTSAQVSVAAEKILQECKAEQWVKVDVLVTEKAEPKQASAGRPGPKTKYILEKHQQIELRWECDSQAIMAAERTDGTFPLVTNDKELSMAEVLGVYKHQPSLEKRFHEMKSVLNVRPVLLHNPARIEAFLFLYFLALLVEALIERETRDLMKRKKIDGIAVHPEARQTATPTAENLFEVFEDLRRHRLVDGGGNVFRYFYDELSDRQREVLKLYDISPKQFMSSAESQ